MLEMFSAMAWLLSMMHKDVNPEGSSRIPKHLVPAAHILSRMRELPEEEGHVDGAQQTLLIVLNGLREDLRCRRICFGIEAQALRRQRACSTDHTLHQGCSVAL